MGFDSIWIVVLVLAVVVGGAIFLLLRKKRRPEELPTPKAIIPDISARPKEERVEAEAAKPPPPVEIPKPGTALEKKLEKTRGSLIARLGKFFGRSSGALSETEWEEIEEALLEGDVGVRTTSVLLDRVKSRVNEGDGVAVRDLFREASTGLFDGLDCGELKLEGTPKPLVISIVGVNGVGKTTTVGKLAAHFQSRGRTVLLAAADTFRAGAIEQLRIWSERVGAQFVTGREGADPGAVSFDAVTAGKSRGVDIVLLDTAGRLHTKDNLMEELKKIHRVVKKVIPEAPHERWLVVDGTLGQNSIQQAKEFHSALELTGVIVTKLDGTAKGGAVLSIASDLKLPIRFIGLGESAEDLQPFSPGPFVEAILG
jgi:fused signal recognition particle receptor